MVEFLSVDAAAKLNEVLVDVFAITGRRTFLDFD